MVKSLVDYFRLANRLFSPAASVARPSYSSGACALCARLQWSLRPKLCPLQTTRSWARRGMLLLASRELCPLRSRCNPCWSTTSCSRCGVQPRLTASSLVPPGICCALQPAGCVYGGMWPAFAGVHIGQAALLVGTSVQESEHMLLVVWDLLSPKPSSMPFLDAPLIPPWCW